MKICGQASFFQWCPSTFNIKLRHHDCHQDFTEHITISGHRTKRVHTYAQQSLAYQAHQNMHIWYMRTLTIFVAKATPNRCSSIEQVSTWVNSTQEFWSRYRWCWPMKALIPPLLPCGNPNHCSHWRGQSMGGLLPSGHHQWGRLFTIRDNLWRLSYLFIIYQSLIWNCIMHP